MAFHFVDYRNQEIELADEVYQTILVKHPEVKQFFDRIGEVLARPDVVRKSQTDVRVNLYYKFYADILKGKYVVAVVKLADRYFISTFYATDKIKEGEIVWKR
jgi:fibronectin type 3 domain-containing protein